MELDTVTKNGTTFLVVPTNDDEGNEFDVLVRTKKAVCPRCHGKGAHLNPAVDGHGISPEQFAEDPDFEEAYFSGVYDVACEECHGKNVVDEPDEDDPNFEHLLEWQRDEAEYRAEIAAERAMGA